MRTTTRGFLDPALLGAIVIGLTLTGCTKFIFDDADDDDDLDDSALSWRADLDGIGAFDELTGEAHVRWVPGTASFSAELELHEDTEGNVRPWHVHFGSCGTGGAIVGPPTSYPPLVIMDDGSDWVSVVIPARLEQGGTYHVNVHLSAAELETIIACGDLVRNGS